MLLVFGLLIFILAFYFIISEKLPSPYATLGAGLLMAMVGIMNEEEMLEAIAGRLEVIFLLVAMMIIVWIISETGFFQWFAIRVAQMVRGNPIALIAILSIVTAVCSAFLDNVTTILLMAPVSILLAKQLELSAFPFLMAEVMGANIGGTATLIGDPTQLIIGSEGNLGFNDFIINTAPLALIALAFLIITVYFGYRKELVVSNELKARIMELDPSRSLKDRKLLKKALIIFGMVILGFILNNFINKGLAVISLSGAVVLMIVAKKTPHEAFKAVEWDTLFFFIGLFIMVKGLENINIIEMVGEKLIHLTEGRFKLATMLVMWVSAAFASILGNVATATTFSQIVHFMEPHFTGVNTQILWWALSFGACLGGNLTILGAATNVVAVSVGDKAGMKIGFLDFMKFSGIIVLQSLLLASAYMLVRYF